MKITTFQPSYPSLEKITEVNAFFDRVKVEYVAQKKHLMFKSGDTPALILYQIAQSNRIYTGILACVDVNAYLDNQIKKHERTIAIGESMQMQLLAERNAAVKPLLLTYTSVAAITSFLTRFALANEPLYSVKLDGETHSFWAISDPKEVFLLQKWFKERVHTAYIADGHHRAMSYANTYSNLKKTNFNNPLEKMFCALFPSDELSIKSFHRVVACDTSLDNDAFWHQLLEMATLQFISKAQLPNQKYEWTMFTSGKWVRLKWRKRTLLRFQEQFPDKVLLDAHILNEKVLKPLLGIGNIRTDTRLQYVSGTQPLAKLEQLCTPKGVAFCLYPVAFEDLKTVADSDGTMPPKSTFFEPRMKNGLIVYDFDNQLNSVI